MGTVRRDAHQPVVMDTVEVVVELGRISNGNVTVCVGSNAEEQKKKKKVTPLSFDKHSGIYPKIASIIRTNPYPIQKCLKFILLQQM